MDDGPPRPAPSDPGWMIWVVERLALDEEQVRWCDLM